VDDGIIDQSPVVAIAETAAKKFICFDMAAAADETNSVISSVMLGAIAAADVLPFGRDAYLEVIRETGRSVEQNLAGFAAGYSGASSPVSIVTKEELPAAKPEGCNGQSLARRIESELPATARDISLHGALRALDYQDAAYANTYVDTLVQFYKDEESIAGMRQEFALTTEVARQLALQMCYEDTLRVADLKTRHDRTRRVRDQLGVADGQPAQVVEYFHPRVEEVCDTLPAGLGRYVLHSPRLKKSIARLFSKGRNIRTSSITGFLMLRAIAGMKRWRRGTYRFSVQKKLISDWLKHVRTALESNYDSALHIAQSIESVKGYGDTYERGLRRYKDAIH
jgi:indolepyruvate ferredoxin oxidoreductase beta subunit